MATIEIPRLSNQPLHERRLDARKAMCVPMSKRKLVVISDYQDGWPTAHAVSPKAERLRAWASSLADEGVESEAASHEIVVEGGYLERLPLACLAHGLVDLAEIWSHWRGDGPPQVLPAPMPIKRRSFFLDGPDTPFSSNDMLAHIEVYGAPSILCVWGLGVSEEILRACDRSYKIYNSIDVPALRVPPSISRHFDLVLTASQAQTSEVQARHPGMPCAILPIGPEFASPTTFYPIETSKEYDLIYVAAAQPYKRHDLLFAALTQLPRSVRALCLFGYGEDAEALRQQAAANGLNVDFVGPPGVPFAEVNRLMNSACMGVVCGIDDGAPAVLTEYMLAGLPVLANAALRCGLQYITPETGAVAAADEFHLGIADMLSRRHEFSPRAAALRDWTWPRSIEKLRHLIESYPQT
ncbi:glycosyltransferase [Ensifer sp. NPDC090286]|uniref:glycosyltransferase n=1 Tax=Ensifer sp. NPDC090286 TaxID=3363991 RepID=UPI00383B3403